MTFIDLKQKQTTHLIDNKNLDFNRHFVQVNSEIVTYVPRTLQQHKQILSRSIIYSLYFWFTFLYK